MANTILKISPHKKSNKSLNLASEGAIPHYFVALLHDSARKLHWGDFELQPDAGRTSCEHTNQTDNTNELRQQPSELKSVPAKIVTDNDFKLIRNNNLVLKNANANINLYLLRDTKQLT